MKIKKQHRPLHLEIQKYGSKYYGIIRTTFRGRDKKIQHTSHGTIKGKTLDELKLIQAAFRGDAVFKNSEDGCKVIQSREYGASYAVHLLAKELELDKAIYSKKVGG